MKFLLESKNSSKKCTGDSIKKLKFSDYEITSYNVYLNSKPVGYEIIREGVNRNLALKEYATKNKFEYDL